MKPYYADESVTLYHGDCLEVQAWLNADALVTDPPYGMNLRSGWDGHQGNLEIQSDQDTSTRDAALTLWGDRPAIVFSRDNLPTVAPRMRLTWDKGEHVGMGDLRLPWKPNTERIDVCGTWPERTTRRASSVLRFLAIAGTAHGAHLGRRHPTEKPVNLLQALIDKAPPGVIADPFAGSGSTLIAARNLGRRAIGVELEERYCEIIARRLAQGVLL